MSLMSCRAVQQQQQQHVVPSIGPPVACVGYAVVLHRVSSRCANRLCLRHVLSCRDLGLPDAISSVERVHAFKSTTSIVTSHRFHQQAGAARLVQWTGSTAWLTQRVLP
jgi:hypothetical protein